ncbi:hypothetical protein PAAG_03016 [Paracoccidioides lutzii Pb01]|uniref:Myb-like domain-containing protein n=1 Tax=Paracoccidioides lutzii (strain ATCC MYA-826 / Pb01) TaxID=502779 RepID=C1GY62_PARBA|nr:hypothetical protein PAAG_03016 [Paracoccidioides lutzii Pb01]EEH41453.2 hypothetical protein PAAG_03016 [Paracoccidioides lutzii Pb01]
MTWSLFNPSVAGVAQGLPAPVLKPCREVSSGKPSRKANQSSFQTITSPFSDNNTALAECESKASCLPPGLVGFSDQHLYSLAKLPGSAGSQGNDQSLWTWRAMERILQMISNPRLLVLLCSLGATGRGIADTSSSPGAKSEPRIPANPRECVQVEIPFLPDALQEMERRGDRSDPSNHSDCSNDSNDNNKAYQESGDDDHDTRWPQKQCKPSARWSSKPAVSFTVCTGDPSPTAVTNNKGSQNRMKKYGKLPASDSPKLVCPVPVEKNGCLSWPVCVCRLPQDDALLKELKEKGEPWGEIAKRFPRADPRRLCRCENEAAAERGYLNSGYYYRYRVDVTRKVWLVENYWIPGSARECQGNSEVFCCIGVLHGSRRTI